MTDLHPGKLFSLLLNWSEVWAVLIPLLIVLFFRKKQPHYLKPVIVYLWAALVLNLGCDVIADFKPFLPSWLQSNNPIYNLHSVVRFACFTYFFIILKKSSTIVFKVFIPVSLVVFMVINFAFYENFFNPLSLSGSLLAVEAYLLLLYCMEYYLSQLRHEVERISGAKEFWVVTGLSIYVVINFFIFLFYIPMLEYNLELAIKMWSIHNVAYIIFCLLIAKAFYVHDGN